MRVALSVRSNGSDPAAEIRRLNALGQTLPGKLAAAVEAVGSDIVLDQARSIRGTLSMSHNKRGNRLDALPILRRGSSHAEVEIQATPRGVWHLVEYGSKGAYRIGPKKGPGGRPRKARTGKGRRGAVRTDRGVFAQVMHPKQRGQRVWERAMAAAEPRIDKVVQEAFEDAVLESVGL